MNGRPLIFKFHPNEDPHRAAREVERHAPEAMHFSIANTDHMIANCEALVTRYSSVVYVAAALGKEIHSDLSPEQLQRLLPLQNGGTSAHNIARECLRLFETGSERRTDSERKSFRWPILDTGLEYRP